MFLDRKTKEPIGSATVTYQSADNAQRAIELFHNNHFNDGGPMNVQIATPDQKNPFAEMLVSYITFYKNTVKPMMHIATTE